LTILGVGVYEPHHGFDDADYSAVELSAATARFRILMAHSPQYWEDCLQGRRPIDLTLVGHTHGGQIGVGIGSRVWSLAALQVRHSAGLYRDGRQYLNVNRGAGYVGLPFRLNMPADVSLIVVRSKRE
jgi:predicted MPP superfamily phosphohydrolase